MSKIICKKSKKSLKNKIRKKLKDKIIITSNHQ